MQRQTTPANPVSCMIITFGMIMGVAMFAGMTLIVDMAPQQGGEPLISYVTAGVGLTAFVAAMVVPGMVAGTLLRKWNADGQQDPQQSLMQIFQTQLIVRLALLEGGAFASLVAFMLERQNWSLLMVGWLVLTMIAFFPTPGRIEDWIRERRELLELEHSTEY